MQQPLPLARRTSNYAAAQGHMTHNEADPFIPAVLALQRGLVEFAGRRQADFYSHAACTYPFELGATDRLHLFTNHRGHWRQYLQGFNLLGDSLPLVLHAAQRLPPLIWSSTRLQLTDARFRDGLRDEIRRATDHGIHSGVICPLLADDLAWGWIALSWCSELAPDRLLDAARALDGFAQGYDALHARLVRGVR